MTALCATVLCVCAVLPPETRAPAWDLTAVAYLAGFTLMIGTATPVQAAALAMTNALIERFGLLIIIVLGETVIGVVDGLAHTPVDTLTLAVGLVAVGVGFGAWWTYFDFPGCCARAYDVTSRLSQLDARLATNQQLERIKAC